MACFPHPATLSMTACRRAASHLRKADPVMRRLIRLHGPCSLGGERAEPFVHLVRAVVGQQVSAGAARSILKMYARRRGNISRTAAGLWRKRAARGWSFHQEGRVRQGVVTGSACGRSELSRVPET